MPISVNPTTSDKSDQLQKGDEAPLSTPIAYNFISSIGTDLGNILPVADLGKPGEALCDKCKLKGAEGGVVEGRGYEEYECYL